MEKIEDSVETGVSSRLAPWQAIFGILTYAIGVFGIENERALILYGLILATLGFTMVSTYKHKEAVKQVVAPWLVEQLLKTISEYLQPQLPPPPEATPEPDPPEPDERREILDRLALLEEQLKQGAIE